MNSCISPQVPPEVPGDGNRWVCIHNRFVSETKEKEPEVLFIGDSITSQLETRCVWREVFLPMHPLNFSIIGDRTQHILWRVLNGELNNIKPKTVVIYAGGLNQEAPTQIADGVVEIVKTVQEKLPEASILVQSILPRGLAPNPARERNEQVNSLVGEKLSSFNRVQHVPAGQGLIASDGSISHLDMYDYFYPTNEGYIKAFGPLIKALEECLLKCGI